MPDAEVDVKTFDMKREISWIFQDYPLLFLEMAYLGNKELQLWDCSTLTQLYSVGLNDPHVRYVVSGSTKIPKIICFALLKFNF